LPTAAEAKECELSELKDKTISKDKVWKDTVFCQNTEDNLYFIDCILAKKQEDRGTYYLFFWDSYTKD
jgi:hypothetical protein